MSTKVLVTGAAGFVGFHLTQQLLARGDQVCGLDNLNDYYAVSLKQDRLRLLQAQPGFRFEQVDVADAARTREVVRAFAPSVVVHLAAQAGVRYSIENPAAYVHSNVAGFLSILEACRHEGIRHLVYASSSSVYGANQKIPFSTEDRTDHPVSLYAATKKSNELMAHTYSHLFGFATTGLRFFTVYGPWGRPDMAYFSFTKAIFEGRPIDLFNHGNMERDFTYVDDITAAIARIVDAPQDGAPPASPGALARLYNIGNHQPVRLLDFVRTLEEHIGKKAVTRMRDMQPGDVPTTYADTTDLQRDFDFKPETPIHTGLKRFVDWYRAYYRPN
jgi:UDP-glucuronate 4-epimerase